MPYRGKVYSAQELVDLLDITKQGVSSLAKTNGWRGPKPGDYWAECVEPLLLKRGIDPDSLPVLSYGGTDTHSPRQYSITILDSRNKTWIPDHVRHYLDAVAGDSVVIIRPID